VRSSSCPRVPIWKLVRSFIRPALAQTPQRQGRQSYGSKYGSDSSIQPPVACRKPLWRHTTLREANNFSNQNGDHSAAEKSSDGSNASDSNGPG
jgi:hypothetical protein